MVTLVDQLGNKAPGLLIKSDDWNALVQEIVDVETRLNARIDGVDTRIDGIDTRIDGVDSRLDGIDTRLDGLDTSVASLTTLVNQVNSTVQDLSGTVGNIQTQINTLQAQVDSLMSNYYQVTMETSRSSYAIGEMAEITATVHDLQGQPMTFSTAASRPWIDFVTVWGQLYPVSGFAVRGGAGNKTLSVQVNAQGVAQVSLRSEFSEDFDDDDQRAVATSLTTNLQPISMTVAQKIVAANTPQEAKIDGAFRALSLEYDRADTDTMRRYVDAHFVKNPAFTTGKLTPNRFVNWRDYRATVLAFAKSDSNPLTPDFTQGASSIQVTFRDWIGPWITLEYLPEVDTHLNDFIGRLNPKITNDPKDSIDLVSDEVINIVQNAGVIGKIQRYTGVRNALNRLTGNPEILQDVVESVGDAIDLQIAETGKPSAVAGVREDKEFALQAQTRAAARSEQKLAGVKSEITQVGATLDTKVNDSISTRIADLEAEGGALNGIRQQIGDVSGKVDQIVEIGGNGSIQSIGTRLQEVDRLNLRMDNFLLGR